jgi:hypothetical protein
MWQHMTICDSMRQQRTLNDDVWQQWTVCDSMIVLSGFRCWFPLPAEVSLAAAVLLIPPCVLRHKAYGSHCLSLKHHMLYMYGTTRCRWHFGYADTCCLALAMMTDAVSVFCCCPCVLCALCRQELYGGAAGRQHRAAHSKVAAEAGR